MEWGLDEGAEGVDEGFAAALYGTHHDVGADAAVEVGLAVDVVAEVVAVGLVLAEVADGPGAADDGLEAEDVGLLPVDFALHHACDVGLELHMVHQQQVAALEETHFEVAFVGALLGILGVEAEDAGGVGGLEPQGGEGAVVGLVDAHMQLFAFRTDDDGASLAHHVLDELVVVGIEVVVAQVEGDVEALDRDIGIDADLHFVGVGGEGKQQEQ